MSSTFTPNPGLAGTGPMYATLPLAAARPIPRRQPMSTHRKTSEAVSRLTPEQYRVTREAATEHPFDNA